MTSDSAIARLVIVLGALVAVGCGDDAASPDAASPDAAMPCARRWNVTDTRVNPGLDVQVDQGALTIALPLASDELVFVGHEGALTGDFQAAFDFEVFVAGDAPASLYATLGLGDPNLIDVPSVRAGIGVEDDGATDLRALLLYHDESRTRFDLVSTKSVEGTLRIVRAGRVITLTATVPSGEMATVSGQVSDAPAGIGLLFSSGAAGKASVRITDFRVEGGGGTVTTDHFDCDSLL